MKRYFGHRAGLAAALVLLSAPLAAHPGHVHGPDTHTANASPVYQQQEATDAKQEPEVKPVDLNQVPDNPAMPKGALSGASIFVNPGHGWLYNSNTGRWHTQRGVSHGVIEDHSNAEAVLQYLVPYLEKAGARVYTARERDFNPNMVIVDDPKLEGPWSEERLPGTYDGQMWFAETTAGEPTATATFTPDIPEAGTYAVYAWYRPTKEGVSPTVLTFNPAKEKATSVKTTFRINHGGGSTDFVQNQNLDTRTWKFLGNYYFEKGKNPGSGSVVVNNATGADGQFVVVDAIRFGGGMSESVRRSVALDSPRYEESGLYNVQFKGLQPEHETRSFNSVSAMPMWAEWEAEPYERGKAVYIGWHTNASAKGESRGLSSFVYGPDAWAKLDRFTGFPGGEHLVQVVHNEVLNDVRLAVEPGWRDVGVITRWLGETNPRNNNKMPAALFEYGFHDNKEDASLILTPAFRRTTARATYQGIVKFFAEHMDGFDNATLLPEPPTHFAAVQDGGNVRLSWQAPPFNSGDGLLGDAATGYMVYTSRNGKGFDNGTPVYGTNTLVAAPSAGETLYYRVVATNEGGISWPTETLAVTSPQNDRKVLVVNGFDRLDRAMNKVLESGGERGILSGMNTYDYAIQHAEAIAPAGFGVDSASNEAVTAQMLANYPAVVWILGQEKGETEALSPAERDLIASYLSQGGSLFISGSELAEELATVEGGQAFLQETLHATFVKGDAGARKAITNSDSLLGSTHELSLEGTYFAMTPDVIAPTGDADVLMSYPEGAAAVQYAGDDYKVVYLAFPFEAIQDPAARREVMARSLEFLTGQSRRTAMK